MSNNNIVSSISEKDLRLLREKFPEADDFSEAMKRLANREPLAYILGEWYFYDEVYKVSPHCLVPRPETEHLVEELIYKLPPNGTFADLCTGSGCIAISVLAHRKDCTAVAVDISADALAVAKENSVINRVYDRINFVQGDILKENVLGNNIYDIIVSNPPYIRSDVIETLEPEVLFEPRIALDGGKEGLDFYRILITKYMQNISHDGYLVCEIGYDQGEVLKKICRCEIKKDYSGNDRVMILKT